MARDKSKVKHRKNTLLRVKAWRATNRMLDRWRAKGWHGSIVYQSNIRQNVLYVTKYIEASNTIELRAYTSKNFRQPVLIEKH